MIEFVQEEYHITSFKKFIDIVEQRHSPTNLLPESWIFRGHEVSDWQLIPGVGRLLGTPRFKTAQELLLSEKTAFHQFEIETYHLLKEPNRFILLAVAQHHGMKTRLLDWTKSPLVALFFAVENENRQDCNAAFYAYNTHSSLTNIIKSDKHPFDDLKAPYQYLSIPSLTPRIQAQNGVFQLFNDPIKPLDSAPYLEKFIIPAKCKAEIKVDLSNFGISYNTLFPDIDGITKTINYLNLSETI